MMWGGSVLILKLVFQELQYFGEIANVIPTDQGYTAQTAKSGDFEASPAASANCYYIMEMCYILKALTDAAAASSSR